MVYKKRKASLQLSINAIVILILGITILGLGLGFIKTQFGKLTDDLGQLNQEMEKQIKEKIEKSGEILVWDQLQVDLDRGKEDVIYFGIKNTDSLPLCFRMEIVCVQAIDQANSFIDGTSQQCNNILVGGEDGVGGAVPVATNVWFKMFGHSEIEAQQIKVFIARAQISSAVPDTYEMEINIYKGSADCASAAYAANRYASEDFTLILNN